MSNYKTTIEQDNYKQWVAFTYIKLEAPKRKLKISTCKSSGLLYTSCQAFEILEPYNGFERESCLLFSDYSKKIKSFPEVKRVTAKTIAEAHNKALEIISQFVEEANEFYKKEIPQG